MTKYKQLSLFVVPILALCTFFFVFDAASDLLEHYQSETPFDTYGLFHLIAEIFTTIALGLGIWIIMKLVILLDQENKESQDLIQVFRSQFDQLVSQRFGEWGLTTAERDVALLSVRGMTIAEIADARSTSSGTIKAQTNAVFRKAGVSSRTELMSLFLDEFLLDSETIESVA